MRIIPARAGPTAFLLVPGLPCADHPRSCGANSMPMIGPYQSFGSSPLVRGQPQSRDIRFEVVRIIPARAGPTRMRMRMRIVVADHPRSCGANETRHLNDTIRHGSSPLVRGQPNDIASRPCLERIIPARAGPTNESRLYLLGNADHPRSCGANTQANYLAQVRDGSSPLVRGQQSDFTRKKRVESNKNI